MQKGVDPKTSSLRVLVLEDEEPMRKLLTEIVWGMGFREVTAVSNGQEGLQEITTSLKQLDLIVCDVDMPVMNGLSFLEELRSLSDRSLANLPVIMITAHKDEATVKKTARFGISGYVIKPLSFGAVQQSIEKALKSKRRTPME